MEPSTYVATTTLKKILKMQRKYRFAAGGTDAAKTSSIVQILLDIAMVIQNKRIDVVSKSIPHVRAGAWQEAIQIIAAQGYQPHMKILHTPDLHIVTPTGTEIHFTSFDTFSKAHGPRRDVLFLNEANYLPWSIANQLMVRTRGPIYADWNPSAPFWAYDKIIDNPDYIGAVDLAHVTYKDNQSLTDAAVQDLERRRSDIAWWRVYGQGLLGNVEGQIYTNWRWIDRIPFEARLVRRGLDFGFTNDETAIVALYEYGAGFILELECYQKGMDNMMIADFLGALKEPQTLVIADSSEPKSIFEVRQFGQQYDLNILPVRKNLKDGSKLDMVQFVRRQPISATKESLGLREEQEQYLWIEDPMTGDFTNQLPDGFDHALDAVLYVFSPMMAHIRRPGKNPTRASDSWDFSKQYGSVQS